MMRSGNVGLVLMGTAAFAGTFAVGTAVMAYKKPSQAALATPQSAVAQPAMAQQAAAQPAAVKPNSAACVQRPDGSQTCQSRGTFVLIPTSGYGSSANNNASAAKPTPQVAALTGNTRAPAPSANAGTVRSGFGGTARSGAYRMSAGS